MFQQAITVKNALPHVLTVRNNFPRVSCCKQVPAGYNNWEHIRVSNNC